MTTDPEVSTLATVTTQDPYDRGTEVTNSTDWGSLRGRTDVTETGIAPVKV
jgi:hypothetical protein